MSYTGSAVLGVLAALVLDLVVLRTRLVLRRIWWVSYAIVLFFQLVTNAILTGRGIVRYDQDQIAGLRIAWAPVEDLLFGFAMVLLTLSLWVWWGRCGVQYEPKAGARPGPSPARRTGSGPGTP